MRGLVLYSTTRGHFDWPPPTSRTPSWDGRARGLCKIIFPFLFSCTYRPYFDIDVAYYDNVVSPVYIIKM